MNEVFVLTVGKSGDDGNEKHIVSIHSTRESAEKAQREMGRYDVMNSDIEDWEVQS